MCQFHKISFFVHIVVAFALIIFAFVRHEKNERLRVIFDCLRTFQSHLFDKQICCFESFPRDIKITNKDKQKQHIPLFGLGIEAI